MKNWKHRLTCLGLSLMLLMSLSLPVWGTEEAAAEETVAVENPWENPTGEMATGLVEAVVKHLNLYGRYDEISDKTLYKAAAEKLMEENPELYTNVLKAMLESVDRYSEYYTAEEAESLMTSVTGEVVGIGVTIDFSDGNAAVIASVIPDTPAKRAGLQVGDIIVSANGVDLRGAKSEIVLSNVRGEEGSDIRLEVERNGAILTFDMVREKIVGTSVTYEVHEQQGKKLMYIRVYGFVSNTAEKFREALEAADAKGVTNLIIDLRDNGGGLFDQAVEMAANFVPEGKIVITADYKIQLFNQPFYGSAPASRKYDTVILTNENTASASEVFTAALRENDLATIVGTNSYGKGTIQTINSLSDGGMIKFTTGYYLTPLGNNINGVGITPDTYVENSTHKVNMDDYGDFDYTRVYSIGDTHEDIRTAKEILAFYGLFHGEINDVFDQELYYAIYAFQTQAQLYPYGVLDITTQIQVRNYLGIIKVEQDDQLEAAFDHFGMTILGNEEEE